MCEACDLVEQRWLEFHEYAVREHELNYTAVR